MMKSQRTLAFFFVTKRLAAAGAAAFMQRTVGHAAEVRVANLELALTPCAIFIGAIVQQAVQRLGDLQFAARVRFR